MVLLDPLQFWSPWRLDNSANNLEKKLGLGEIEDELIDLLSPERLLDILRIFLYLLQIKRNKDQSYL